MIQEAPVLYCLSIHHSWFDLFEPRRTRPRWGSRHWVGNWVTSASSGLKLIMGFATSGWRVVQNYVMSITVYPTECPFGFVKLWFVNCGNIIPDLVDSPTASISYYALNDSKRRLNIHIKIWDCWDSQECDIIWHFTGPHSSLNIVWNVARFYSFSNIKIW